MSTADRAVRARGPRPAGTREPAGRRGGLDSLGAVTVVAFLAVITLAWAFLRPAGFANRQYVGELFGVLAVACLSAALVLTMRVPAVERAFGGLDRVYVWHRILAISGLVLFLPHWLFVGGGRSAGVRDPASPAGAPHYGPGNLLGVVSILGLTLLAVISLAPRIPVLASLLRLAYRRWLASHRLAGLLVAAAVVHGLMVDPVIRASAGLWWVYLAVGAMGVAAFATRVISDLRGWGRADHVVTRVERLSPNLLEVWMRPRRSRLDFTPGQFVYASFGGTGYWQPHPFTISSSPADPDLRLSIRSNGDHTTSLYRHLTEGIPVAIEGPYGGFHHELATGPQVWIAGGIGVTPFLSWAGADDVPAHVDLFYVVPHAGDAVYLDELHDAAARNRGLHVHLSTDDRDGFLTADRVAGAITSRLQDCSVFMCGPPPMIRSLEAGLVERGVRPEAIHYEEFSFR
ncbi:MAG: ferric reductase-like transmembrane domain-containing protein [Thermoleophilia bacterium]